jgi:hypothetical protein
VVIRNTVNKIVKHYGESSIVVLPMISENKQSAELIFKFLAPFSSDFFLALSAGRVIATMRIVQPLQTSV